MALATVFPLFIITGCPDRTLVGPIHYLNLHCRDEVHEQKLRARPAWRESSGDAFIERHRQFALWQLEHAAGDFDPPMATLDTTEMLVADVAHANASWVRKTLSREE